jgi:hypothetical protein
MSPESLPQGQITPAARPISAFLQPKQVNIAAPAQMVQMPDPTGITTIGTGGTPSVQGANNLAEAAESLSAFNKQLMPAMEAAGLAYVSSRTQAGELAYKKAREQMLRATAANDASMETAQLDRAAANRALAVKDPQAGQWMAMLDPYMKVGWERGKAKLAAQQIAIGMDDHISRNAQIDYTAPDQGFGGLVKARAEYVSQVAQEYGISETSPGFQRYTAPAIEKAAEKAALRLVADRKKYFDSTAVSQGAALLRGVYTSAIKDKQVELNGQVYSLSGDDQTRALFWSALAIKGSTLIEQTALAGTFPGDATERSKGIFNALAAEADYKNNKDYRYFIEQIPSNEFRRGADGKVLISPSTGQPLRLTWGERWRQESIDSEIKYSQAGYANRKRVREEALEGVNGFEEGLLNATSGFPPGPARQAAADQYVKAWYDQGGRQAGISLSDLQKRRKTVMELNSALFFEGTDTGAAPSFFQELSETQGSAFSPAAWRRRIQQDASRIKDPAEQLTFIKSANSAVADKEREKASFTGYNSARDKVISATIKANLDKYYGPESSRNEVDRNESLRRQTSAFAPFVNSRINDAEARKKQKLTDSEVRTVTSQALEEYGTKSQDGRDQKDNLFPGSKFTNVPSVSPRLKPGLNQGVPPAAKQQANAYKGATYQIADLDKFPDRRIKLQNFRNEPVLSADSIEDLIDAVTDGKDWPIKFERAWRDAGAKSGGEFIFEHIDNYYPGLFQLPPTLRQKIQKRAAVQAGAGDYMVAYSRIQAEMPGLSSLSGWAFQALIGA